MTTAVQALIDILTLEPVGGDRWRGRGSREDGAEGTYGGHLLGQATAAALASVEPDRTVHSLHAYFLRGGTPGQAYEYVVSRVRDGRSFSVRRVAAYQDERLIFELTASLTIPASGRVIRPAPPPDFATLPAPDRLPGYSELMAGLDPLPLPVDWARRELAIELRPVNAPWTERGPSTDGGIRHWIRAAGPLPANPALHCAMLAYQTDESISDNVLIPFDVSWGTPGMSFVSLDHALWLHRPVDLNDWLFVEQWPGVAAHGRGLAHGRVWTRDGDLVASYTQEALMRFDD